LLPNGQARKLFDLVERLSDVRSNSLAFGRFGDVVLQLDCKIGAYKLKRIGLSLELILGETGLKHVLREILQDASRINHAGVDLLRVHLDGQEA
jgi:hypothetical protein